jgi:hypothetical protein
MSRSKTPRAGIGSVIPEDSRRSGKTAKYWACRDASGAAAAQFGRNRNKMPALLSDR